MKKFLASLSMLGLLAGLAATSYAVPASAAATDQAAVYDGPTTNVASEIVIIIIETPDYIYYVEYYEGAAANVTSASSGALTDAAFDR